MFGLQRIFVFITLLTSTFVLAAPHHQDDSLVDWGRLSEILDTIDNNILHSVLHNLSPKFRDGVFSKDRAAIEHVHSNNPVMASKLVYLAKRQNGTTTAEVSTTASTAVVVSTSTSAAAASTVAASTTQTVAADVSSAVSSQLTQSTLPAPTTVIISPTVPTGATAISTASGKVIISTIGGGVATLTSSAVAVKFTKSTSTHLFTVTGGNGQLTTSTQLVVVNAPVTAIATGAAAAGTTSTSPPGLQSDASQSNIISMFGAMLAGLLSLFIAL